MAASAARHRHRHYKTLIALVLSMTGGTLFLLWVGRLSPVIPLRGQVPAPQRWSEITVRAENDHNPRGFFHLRIDEAGQLYQSSAWKIGQPDPDHPETILVLLTSVDGAGISTAQTQTLSRTLADLRREHGISPDHVSVIDGRSSQAAVTDWAVRF
jgi:hypothetical protein